MCFPYIAFATQKTDISLKHLQIQYAAQVALQRCLILRIDKAYILYHFPCNLSIGLISNNIFCPTLGGRFTPCQDTNEINYRDSENFV